MNFKRKFLNDFKNAMILQYQDRIDRKITINNIEGRKEFVIGASKITEREDALFDLCCELIQEIIDDEFGELHNSKTVH